MPDTATDVLDQATTILARHTGAIVANPHVGRQRARVLSDAGLLAGSPPAVNVYTTAVATLWACGESQETAAQAVNQLAEAGLLAKETNRG